MTDPMRVPAAPIVTVIKTYLERQINMNEAQMNGERFETPLQQLAFQADVNYDTLYRYVERGDRHSMHFDYADRLLCAIGRAQLWFGPLREVYEEVELSDDIVGGIQPPARASGQKLCAGSGCTTLFTPGQRTPWQKYCSNACKHRSYMQRRREKEGAPKRYGTRYGACPNGHERTHENTHVRRDGTITCRECNKEKEKERYRTDPEYRAKKIQQERDRRAKRRVERLAA